MSDTPIKAQTTLTSDDFTLSTDPEALFRAWMDDAEKSEVNDPNAMAFSTSDADGMPNVRVVLLKEFNHDGFCFYTNFESIKGRELEQNPKGAINFHWKSLRRQIRAQGVVTKVAESTSDTYFNTRPRDSRIGAWASQQSRPLGDRQEFEDRIEHFRTEFAQGDVPRPPHWGGYLLSPLLIEFWQDRKFRLHDRIVFTRENAGAPWTKTRLYP